MKVILGDASYPKSECLVLPANSVGVMKRGLPYKIINNGNKKLLKEVKEYVKSSKVEVGQCFKTGPARLRIRGVKAIYHAVTKKFQNDFESVRPIPLDVVQTVMDSRPRVGWVRLYGINKNDTIKGGNPTNPTHKFKPGQPLVKWKPFEIAGERLEIGDIHWCYHPAINRREVLLKIIQGVKSERDAAEAALKTGCLTVRFMRNITNWDADFRR